MPYKPLGINLNRDYRNDLNGMLKELYDRISNIVAQAGSDNTEIVDARLGVDGQVRPTLGDFIRELQQQIIDLQENGGNQEEIDQLNTRVTAVENVLAGKANVEDLNNVISALNTKANQSDLTNLQNTVTSHLVESVSQVINFSRDLSLTGIYSITITKKPKSVIAIGQVSGSSKISNGFAGGNFSIVEQNCVFRRVDETFWEHSNYNILVFEDEKTNPDRTLVTITSVTDTEIQMEFTKSGTGATGTANIQLLIQIY